MRAHTHTHRGSGSAKISPAFWLQRPHCQPRDYVSYYSHFLSLVSIFLCWSLSPAITLNVRVSFVSLCRPAFEIQADWTSMRDVASLSLSFLLCKMGILELVRAVGRLPWDPTGQYSAEIMRTMTVTSLVLGKSLTSPSFFLTFFFFKI